LNKNHPDELTTDFTDEDSGKSSREQAFSKWIAIPGTENPARFPVPPDFSGDPVLRPNIRTRP
jgi:hypothetical protein